MKKNRDNNVIQYRFSLVEILLAIAIIAILLGLSGAGYNAVQRKIARARTEATLNKIRVGLESYKSKFGYYPQQTVIAPFHLDINDPQVAAGQPQNNFNSFIEYSKMSKEDAVVVGSYPVNGNPVNYYAIIDGWKTNISNYNCPFILYMCPGLVNTSSYDLFSAGNDRKYDWTSTTTNAQVNADNIWPQGLKTN
jgi:type II secretory pathway pseudopilin PulG